MKEEIRPLADRILVEPDDAAKNFGNIIIPDTAKEKPQRGTVISVGHTISIRKEFKDGVAWLDLPAFKAGDTILFAKHAGIEITINGKRHLLMRESECFAVIEHPNE